MEGANMRAFLSLLPFLGVVSFVLAAVFVRSRPYKWLLLLGAAMILGAVAVKTKFNFERVPSSSGFRISFTAL
jgi:hypothetical protein